MRDALGGVTVLSVLPFKLCAHHVCPISLRSHSMGIIRDMRCYLIKAQCAWIAASACSGLHWRGMVSRRWQPRPRQGGA